MSVILVYFTLRRKISIRRHFDLTKLQISPRFWLLPFGYTLILSLFMRVEVWHESERESIQISICAAAAATEKRPSLSTRYKRRGQREGIAINLLQGRQGQSEPMYKIQGVTEKDWAWPGLICEIGLIGPVYCLISSSLNHAAGRAISDQVALQLHGRSRQNIALLTAKIRPHVLQA